MEVILVTTHITVRNMIRTSVSRYDQFSSVAQSCPTICNPMTAACQASQSITNSQSLLKLMFIKSVIPFNHLILCRPLLLLPSIFPSIRIFSNESVLCSRWPKYWRFSFSISPSNEYSGLISFQINRFDLLAVQRTLKSLLQHHGSKASILQCSAFFIVQLSHPYMTTRKTIALTGWTFIGKVMSLLFNMLSRLIIDKITTDDDCSHEIKRHLLLWRKAMTNLDSRYGRGSPKTETQEWLAWHKKTIWGQSHLWSKPGYKCLSLNRSQ